MKPEILDQDFRKQPGTGLEKDQGKHTIWERWSHLIVLQFNVT
ncbi:hypothetical protein ACJIZ3_014318 [Penstemon smallii]|uniref:Uncharacterized protein n=1 Tax=Penstemon smallii TaxID=265156 RepID=A0ABD3RJ82_9LAMI